MTQRPQVVSISGGKDSQATAILAIDRHGPENVRLVMADTGHEHPATMEFVTDYLPNTLGVPVEIVRADFSRQIANKRQYIATVWEYEGVPLAQIDRALAVLQPTGNPYLDLCLWKGRFPSRMAQFCTAELKSKPLDDYHMRVRAAASWQGVRRDESASRRHVADEEPPTLDRPWSIVRPIAGWTAQEVVSFVLSRGHRLNPLYSQGMRRVGCMPCINCGKAELREIAARWPEEIARVREWETMVANASKRARATFFADSDSAPRTRLARDAGEYAGIDTVVDWARTSRGGVQYDLEAFTPPAACLSEYGLCE